MKTTKILVVIVLVILTGSYFTYQGYDFIRGPIINIYIPENGSSFEDPVIDIEGEARNISFLYLNDNQIFTTPEGFFSEKLILLPGYNIITIRAIDKFNRQVEKDIHLILK
ncbi:MAG: hypothetical protein MRY49_02235 [Candidatus Pacebacteria bacterium]|nr:hypothetical protein [Candidatus Paceibacterota bacterium]